jgi:hypothetical protein
LKLDSQSISSNLPVQVKNALLIGDIIFENSEKSPKSYLLPFPARALRSDSCSLFLSFLFFFSLLTGFSGHSACI